MAAEAGALGTPALTVAALQPAQAVELYVSGLQAPEVGAAETVDLREGYMGSTGIRRIFHIA